MSRALLVRVISSGTMVAGLVLSDSRKLVCGGFVIVFLFFYLHSLCTVHTQVKYIVLIYRQLDDTD